MEAGADRKGIHLLEDGPLLRRCCQQEVVSRALGAFQSPSASIHRGAMREVGRCQVSSADLHDVENTFG
jgi:hypothetical protein